MARRNLGDCRGLLTGASSGIGRALALELVRAGARLVVVARRPERLEELAAQLQGAPGKLEIVVGDVTDPELRTAALRRAEQAFGGLNLLINNAGMGAMGSFIEAGPERLRQVLEVNFFAAAELTRLAVPLLKASKHPMVVNVGSVLGHRGIPNCAEYCASKFALQGLSESLRAEFVPLGIDLLVVSPARTQTEFFDQALGERAPAWPGMRGMTSEAVAKKIKRAIQAGRHEIVISAGGKLLVWSSKLFPRVLDYFLARNT